MSKTNNENTENPVKTEKKLKVISKFRDRYTFEFYNLEDTFEIDESLKTGKETKRTDISNPARYLVSKTRYDELSKLKYVKEV